MRLCILFYQATAGVKRGLDFTADSGLPVRMNTLFVRRLFVSSHVPTHILELRVIRTFGTESIQRDRSRYGAFGARPLSRLSVVGESAQRTKRNYEKRSIS